MQQKLHGSPPSAPWGSPIMLHICFHQQNQGALTPTGSTSSSIGVPIACEISSLGSTSWVIAASAPMTEKVEMVRCQGQEYQNSANIHILQVTPCKQQPKSSPKITLNHILGFICWALKVSRLFRLCQGSLDVSHHLHQLWNSIHCHETLLMRSLLLCACFWGL